MAEQMFVAADEVQAGDFIPSLDNAYVYSVEEDGNSRPFLDEYGCDLSSDKVVISYHDIEGEEGYLLLTPATRIEVRRGTR